MLFSAILLVPGYVHAATGQVSVNNGMEIVTSQTATTVSVPIQISGSDPLNGFDIQVFADPTILQAASFSLSGSVITSPTIVIECVNGILVAGSTCAPQDGNGVFHLGVVQIGTTLVSGTGLLVTINYNIVGQTAGTPISFNTGCSGTSIVSGDCVTISNGTQTAVSETDLNGSFANLNDFAMTPDFAKLSTPAGVSISENINYKALGAFSDLLSETVSVSPSGPTCATTNGFVDLTVPTGSDMLTCSSASNGDFTVTVTAAGAVVTHSTNIDLLVASASFSSALNPTSLTIPRGSTGTTMVTLTGVSSFSGTVAITASGPTGITGSASPAMVTLTPDASGYSTATSTLTISVDNTVADGTYSVTVTGGSTLTVTVPPAAIALSISPDSVFVPRGSTIATQVNLQSLGAFAGPVTLTATITPTALDNDGVNNIVSAFLPATVTLTAGGSGSSAYSAGTVKIGTSPNPANTATGNYSITITATATGVPSQRVTLFVEVQDFVLGPNFCPGNTPVFGTPDGEYVPAFIGQSCNSFTLTTQTVANGGAESNLYVQVNALGGLQTNGASFTPGIQSGDPTGPGRGRFVPELGFRICFFQTYFANGTQIAPSYLEANGPIVRGDPTDGCRGDGEAFPNDIAATGVNIDFYAVTADALSHTQVGTYMVNVCGEIGTLVNCEMVTLIVIRAPHQGQAVFSHKVSISAGGVWTFKGGITNLASVNIYAQLLITGVGSLGDTFSQTTATVLIAPGASVNNLSFSVQLTSAEIGEKFTFTTTVIASAVDPGSVLVSSFSAGNPFFDGFFPPFTASGTSTLQSAAASFTVVA
jgi:hypothetical protein